MSCKGYGIHQDYVITDDTIVGDVYIGHDEAIRSDGGFAIGLGATVDGHTLSDGGAVAYFYSGGFTVELEVLGDG
jgi:hypothetical protein